MKETLTNNNKIIFILINILFLSQLCISQVYEVSGTISDAKTNKPLEYVTVKVADTSFGTTSEKNGKYFIRLKPGGYKLVFSYIGYFTDTSYVYIENKNMERNIFLKPSELLTEQIDVYGEDPAYEIIRKAIKYKKRFKANLNEYEYDAYSKFVIRSNQSDIPKNEISTDSAGQKKLGIFGILESETKGYFRKPDQEKQIVVAKKETANISRGFALPLIVNFYDEKIDFGEFKIPAPLADNAFDNYEYKLVGTTSMDSNLIYKIDVINSTENKPLLKGRIYIQDSIYSLMRVDLTTNDAAKPLGIKIVNFKQKFSSFTDKNGKEIFWMPTDIQIFANGSFAGLIKFEAEVFTIVSHYDLNKKAPKGIFDDFVVQVLPDAKKDSAYWVKEQMIKNSTEEKRAYKSIEKETAKKERSLSFGLTTINYGTHFSSSPINYYHFNRVEGNALTFDLNYRGRLNRINGRASLGYGFSDKKTKYNIEYTQRLFNDRRLSINANFFQKLQTLSLPIFLGISELYNTMKALFDKKDNLDYFYSTGYTLGINYRLIPQLGFGLVYNQEKQTTAYKNTNFSIFKKDVEFSQNPVINNAFQRVIGANLRIDPNSFNAIDWGDGDVSRFKVSNFPVLNLGFRYSGKSLNSTYEWRRFMVNLNGRNYFNNVFNIRYGIGGELGTGQIPFQSLSYFSSNSGTIDVGVGFYAMKYQEFLGDKIFYFNFENNFGKLIWGNIPVLNNFNLIGFFAAAKSEISNSNYELAATKTFSTIEGIYMEAGVGIGRILDIFRLNFAWRLNNFYQGSNRVFFSLWIDPI